MEADIRGEQHGSDAAVADGLVAGQRRRSGLPAGCGTLNAPTTGAQEVNTGLCCKFDGALVDETCVGHNPQACKVGFEPREPDSTGLCLQLGVRPGGSGLPGRVAGQCRPLP